ncbi:MAG TPA: hypothetical protein VKJ07_14950, partial [Mycobacteriales bacterium]|nr:hypothetical protein [Mycobacteriales bacterium]
MPATLGSGAAAPGVFSARDTTTVFSVTTACQVRMTLTGGDAFKIDQEAQTQGFVDRPTLTFSWYVTPELPGKHQLTRRVQSLYASDLVGGEDDFAANITATVKGQSVLRRVGRVLNNGFFLAIFG